MVNYPNGHKKSAAIAVANPTQKAGKNNAGGRGMELEKEINTSNAYYLSMDRAVIYKKPTPITIVKVDYPMRSAAKISEAYFKIPSTTDYNGIYRGKYIDFEAKDCQSRTSFPLKSIHEHQIRHLEDVVRHGAVAFVIIRFVYYGETYLVDAKILTDHIHATTRHSIPYKWFREHGELIPMNYLKPVDYLQVVDRMYFKESTE